jgi:hypothetical protein
MKLSVRTVAALFVAAASAAGALLAVPACSLLVPTNELQCSTSDDCRARGPSFASAVCVANVCQSGSTDAGVASEGGAAWDCLGQPPAPGASPASQVDVQVLFYDAFGSYQFGGTVDAGSDLNVLGYSPQSGVTVSACAPLDPICMTPTAGPVMTDDGGIASLTVPGDFVGFYELSQPGAVPSLFYPAARLLATDQPMTTFPTSMTSEADYMALQASLGIPANSNTDAGPGLLSVTQFDCNDRHAAGVVFTSSPAPEETLYLTASMIPIMTDAGSSSEGAGVLVNVPSGSATVTSALAGPNGRMLSTATVLVRPGTITLVYLRPRTHR